MLSFSVVSMSVSMIWLCASVLGFRKTRYIEQTIVSLFYI